MLCTNNRETSVVEPRQLKLYLNKDKFFYFIEIKIYFLFSLNAGKNVLIYLILSTIQLELVAICSSAKVIFFLQFESNIIRSKYTQNDFLRIYNLCIFELYKYSSVYLKI